MFIANYSLFAKNMAASIICFWLMTVGIPQHK